MNKGGFISRSQAFLKYLTIGILSIILEELVRINFLIYYPMGLILHLLFLYSVYVILTDKWKSYQLKEKKPKKRVGDHQRRYFPMGEAKLVKTVGTSLLGTASLVLGYQAAVTTENFHLVAVLQQHECDGNLALMELLAKPRFTPWNYFNNTLPPGFLFPGGYVPIYSKPVVGVAPTITHYIELSRHLCTSEMNKLELLEYLTKSGTVRLSEELTFEQMRSEAIGLLLK